MKDATPYTIDLELDKVKFLLEMVEKHKLKDMGKAIRCLVNWARENPDQHRDIFHEVRCIDC